MRLHSVAAEVCLGLEKEAVVGEGGVVMTGSSSSFIQPHTHHPSLLCLDFGLYMYYLGVALFTKG
jgi:hypothetical protein